MRCKRDGKPSRSGEERIGNMDGETRRKEILKYISESNKPVSGTKLAEIFQVSRQVIVQDIALLRAADCEILSTNRGYICSSPQKCMRIIQVYHTDERIEEEHQRISEESEILQN